MARFLPGALIGLVLPALAGAAWTAQPAVGPGPDSLWPRDLEIISSSIASDGETGKMYVTAGRALYSGEADCAGWRRLEPDSPDRLARQEPLAARGDLILWGGLRSLDRGATWDTSRPYFGATAYAITASGRILAGTHGDAIERSEDGGETWIRARLPRTYGYITGITILPAGGILAATLYANLLASLDGGLTWKELTHGHPMIASLLTADPGPAGDRAWTAGAGYGRPPSIHLVRQDGPEFSFLMRTPSRGFPDSTLTALAATPSGPGRVTLWLGTRGQGVFASEDSGATWTPRNEGLKNLHVESLAASPCGRLLVLTRDGLYAGPMEGTRLRRAESRGPGRGRRAGAVLFSGPRGTETPDPSDRLFRADGRAAGSHPRDAAARTAP